MCTRCEISKQLSPPMRHNHCRRGLVHIGEAVRHTKRHQQLSYLVADVLVMKWVSDTLEGRQHPLKSLENTRNHKRREPDCEVSMAV